MTTRKIDIDTPETMFTACNWSNCASQIKRNASAFYWTCLSRIA